jgi:hypothetical protein
VLLVDGGHSVLGNDEPFELLGPADVGIEQDELARRATMYSAQALVASMKPDLLAGLLARDCGPVILMDADSCVYGDLTPVAQLAERSSLVLSPHILQPQPPWSVDGPEQIVMRAGVMNAGFLGVGPGGLDFLRWWSERTARRCVFDERHGLMLGQTWLTLAGALFDHHVLRDPGCNVAGWNLQVRDIEWDAGRPAIEGGPLRHFHFAGSFDPERPDLLTTIPAHARWWPMLKERPGVARLARDYARELLEGGYRHFRQASLSYQVTPEGTPIEPWMRESYRAALIEAEQDGSDEPPNPFSGGEAAFFSWLELRVRRQREQATGLVAGPVGAESSLERRELATALLESRTLLERIAELEAIRDETVAWAERVSLELREAERALMLEQSGRVELERLRATMEGVWSSASWRMTKPLRSFKAILARR